MAEKWPRGFQQPHNAFRSVLQKDLGFGFCMLNVSHCRWRRLNLEDHTTKITISPRKLLANTQSVGSCGLEEPWILDSCFPPFTHRHIESLPGSGTRAEDLLGQTTLSAWECWCLCVTSGRRRIRDKRRKSPCFVVWTRKCLLFVELLGGVLNIGGGLAQ